MAQALYFCMIYYFNYSVVFPAYVYLYFYFQTLFVSLSQPFPRQLRDPLD